MNAYGKLYRKACREALRVELQKAIARIQAATHVVVYRWDSKVCHYGDLRDCEDFVIGLERDVRVEPMTVSHKEIETTHKVQVYRRNP